jgi:hypothetical protein
MDARAEQSERRSRAIAAFKAENARDPNRIQDGAEQRPRELVDAERLAVWVQRVAPHASEALTLASHCQHLRRWELPRAEYEPGRVGYLKWRKALSKFHADRAGEILRSLGYDAATLEAVRQINLKQGMQHNPEVQAMEDALCLAFLEHEIGEFSAKHADDKLIDIIAKTWGKMSETARRMALELPLDERVAGLVGQALARDSSGAEFDVQ